MIEMLERWHPHAPRARRIIEILIESGLIFLVMLLIGYYFPKGEIAYPIGSLLIVLNLTRLCFGAFLRDCFDFLYRWRWVVALIVFTLLVKNKIHTSNAAALMEYFTPDASVEDSILFGTYREIRSDEYAVQLPYYFSQFYNDFSQISHQMSVGGQDMIVGYNAPVLGLTLIGKPFVWGYLLFGNEYGLSWYFSLKTILMFMVSLEMFHILTRNRWMSVFGAFILTYAPAMQWWYSPHFYDVCFWAVTLFVVGYWFFMFTGGKKWAMTLLAICSLTGFVLALFPSLQVPMGILMLCLMIACLWRDRADLQFCKLDLLNVAVVIIGVGIVLVPALLSMREALQLLNETDYPGARIVTGGRSHNAHWMYFINPISIVQPFVDPSLSNNSELSSYSHFGIACVLFFPYLGWYLFKQKNNSRWIGVVLFAAMIIQGLFMEFEIPEWLARITLLSYCNRMQTVYGFTATIFTVWTVWIVTQVRLPRKQLVALGVCVVYTIAAVSVAHYMTIPSTIDAFSEVLGAHTLDAFGGTETATVFVVVVLGFFFWLAFTKWRQLFLAFMLAWTALSGCLVNPIMCSDAAVTDYAFAREVAKIVEDDPDAWWLTTGHDFSQALVLANGGKVLNGVNFYPDFEKWELIDPKGKYHKLENRYAHILVEITNDKKMSVEKIQNDWVMLRIPSTDLKKLDVSYISGGERVKLLLDGHNYPYTIVWHDPKTDDYIFDVAPDHHKQAWKEKEEVEKDLDLDLEDSESEQSSESSKTKTEDKTTSDQSGSSSKSESSFKSDKSETSKEAQSSASKTAH